MVTYCVFSYLPSEISMMRDLETSGKCKGTQLLLLCVALSRLEPGSLREISVLISFHLRLALYNTFFSQVYPTIFINVSYHSFMLNAPPISQCLLYFVFSSRTEKAYLQLSFVICFLVAS